VEDVMDSVAVFGGDHFGRAERGHKGKREACVLLVADDPVGQVDLSDPADPVADLEAAYVQASDLFQVLLERVERLLGVDTAAILLLDRDGSQLVARAAQGLEDEVRQGVRVPVGMGFAGQIAATRAPVILDEVSPRTVVNPILWNTGVRSMLGVPLLVDGRLLGVMHVGTLHHRRFTEDDVGILEREAARVARLVREHQALDDRLTARTLQESLLPGRLPELDGLELAARFVAAEDVGVGGDWFDVFELPDGRVGIVMGDVAGVGLRAAIVMTRLRSALRAYAIESTTPSQALARLTRKFAHFEPNEMATVLYITIAPDRESFTCSSTGHLPPILAAPGAESTLLECSPGPPIGSHLSAHPVDVVHQLLPGTLVGCYTDGLIERRNESIDVGLERLRTAFHNGDPDIVCSSVMAQLIGSSNVQDDTALLVFRRMV
jgi:phosphoserine phosphatase RsbU/P